MKIFGVIYLAVVVFIAGCWIGNCIKFVKCDFEAPYKGEIIHGIGFFPGVSMITVWFDDK